MKKIIVFDVENVLFNVKNVEKRVDDRKKLMEGMSDFDRREEMKKMDNYMKGSIVKSRMEKGVKDEMERLEGLKRVMKGVRLYVVSRYGREIVGKLLMNNGIVVDGIYGSVNKIIENEGFEGKDVIYFNYGGFNCEVTGIKNVLCKWGGKYDDLAGIDNMGDIWSEIGLKVVEKNDLKQKEGKPMNETLNSFLMPTCCDAQYSPQWIGFHSVHLQQNRQTI